MTRLRLAIAQTNPTVGDLAGNVDLLHRAWTRAKEAGADLVIASEMVLSGYPCEDQVTKKSFLKACATHLEKLASLCADGPAFILGAPLGQDKGLPFNAAFLLEGGSVKASVKKHVLPNYEVFDEVRVFQAGPVPGPLRLNLKEGGFIRLGVMVCEDMWFEDVSEALEESAAEILIVINGSPFSVNKEDARLHHAVARVTETGLPLIYVNQVGGQDDIIFDGTSFALDKDCRLALRAESFRPGLHLLNLVKTDDDWSLEAEKKPVPPLEPLEKAYFAAVRGLRDYVEKNGFPGVLLGLSGGIDSALSAAIATDALGADKVRAIMMPSRFTSKESLDDATACASLLKIQLDEINIEESFQALKSSLAPVFKGRPEDLTEENLQARIRGILLMAVSNKFGSMVVTTGNKSEIAVGYATLYGDMCGGYNAIKDLYKTEVFALAKWRNQNKHEDWLGPEGAVMPDNIISKPPTAELREDQKDEDSLPPYDLLDKILYGLIEEDLGAEDLIAKGLPEADVLKTCHLLDLAEYKRRQAAPGAKVSIRAFDRERRYPITNKFRKLIKK